MPKQELLCVLEGLVLAGIGLLACRIGEGALLCGADFCCLFSIDVESAVLAADYYANRYVILLEILLNIVFVILFSSDFSYFAVNILL